MLMAGAMCPAMAHALAEDPGGDTKKAGLPALKTKVVLVLSRREISVIRDGQKLGLWPVAIGAPSLLRL